MKQECAERLMIRQTVLSSKSYDYDYEIENTGVR